MCAPEFPDTPRERALPVTGLALVGYRGTGKSTVGRRLAALLGRPFADADDVLEGRLQRSIREIFTQDGEPVFRDHEEAILAELCQVPGLILATGGGAVLRESNRRVLRQLGTVIWLVAEPEAIADRLRADTARERPALTSSGLCEEVAEVLARREPRYREVADATVVTTGRTADEVAEAVLRAWLDHDSQTLLSTRGEA